MYSYEVMNSYEKFNETLLRTTNLKSINKSDHKYINNVYNASNKKKYDNHFDLHVQSDSLKLGQLFDFFEICALKLMILIQLIFIQYYEKIEFKH